MTNTRKARRDAKRLFRLCVVDGLLDEDRARFVVSRAIASGRGSALHALVLFRRLVENDVVRRRALVESATPLAAYERARIEAGLLQTHGRGLNIIFAENAALLAGVRVRVGGDVYDGSLSADLAALEASF